MNRQEEFKIANELLSSSLSETEPSHSKSDQKSLFIIGCDEAGRGPLCGPVVAGATCIFFDNSVKDHSHPKQLEKPLPGLLSQLGDSKKLSEATRDKLYAELIKQSGSSSANASSTLHNTCIASSTVTIDAEEIDELNILEASLKGMEWAADNVINQLDEMHKQKKISEKPTEKNCIVLIDGPYLPRSLRPAVVAVESSKNDDTNTNTSKKKKAKKENPKAEREAAARKKLLPKYFTKFSSSSHHPLKGRAVIKGDAKCPSISAASILAKVKRDEIMSKEVAPNLDKSYNILKNKGYPTSEHMAALEKMGPTKFHRKSYKPVQDAIEKFNKKKKKQGKKEKVTKNKNKAGKKK